MRTSLAFATVFLGLLLAITPLSAHHSFSATYDGNKPITLRGTIVKMGWQNPHAHLYVDVKNADGKVVTWKVESAGPTALMKQGLRKEDFVGAAELDGASNLRIIFRYLLPSFMSFIIARLTLAILVDTSREPPAACSALRAISAVVAFCCVTAAAIVAEILWISSIVPLMA